MNKMAELEAEYEEDKNRSNPVMGERRKWVQIYQYSYNESLTELCSPTRRAGEVHQADRRGAWVRITDPACACIVHVHCPSHEARSAANLCAMCLLHRFDDFADFDSSDDEAEK